MLSSSIFAALMASYYLDNDQHTMESLFSDTVPDLITSDTESPEPEDPNSELFLDMIKVNYPKLIVSNEIQENAPLLDEDKYMKQALLAFDEHQYGSRKDLIA